MSTPSIDHTDPLNGAISELVSAESALNMDPDPIHGATGYLSETDAWAKHAMEHIHAVFQLLLRAERERSELRGKLRLAENALRK